MSPRTVVVGMSGGVDSSVSALLLKQQGFRVIGLFMKNWEEKDENGVCLSTSDYEDVVRVCEKIDIPYYAVNFSKEYWNHVFSMALEDFEEGSTPNPDILCNREIKFKVLLERALQLGAEYLATGHYCQNKNQQLHKGADPGKDQSYFLHTITDKILEKVLFPIGHLQKSEVREIARKYHLPTAEKKDSTGLCFVGERNFREFLSQYITPKPGNFEDVEGKIIGTHVGIPFYTIGQRRGIGIGGAGEAWYVVDKDPERNVVILAQGEDHPALFCEGLQAAELSWVSSEGPPSLPYSCKAKIRYRQEDQECTIVRFEDSVATVRFKVPQRAVTCGQSIVFYNENQCIGGGKIIKRMKN